MKLIAIDSVSKTTVNFGENWLQERYDYWFSLFRLDHKIHKVIKIENDIEEVLIER